MLERVPADDSPFNASVVCESGSAGTYYIDHLIIVLESDTSPDCASLCRVYCGYSLYVVCGYWYRSTLWHVCNGIT